MSNSYFYNSKEKAFYSPELKDSYLEAGTWCEDMLEVTQDIYEEYIQPKKDMQLGSSVEGNPCWIKSEINPAISLAKRKAMELRRASEKIAVIQNVIEMGLADEKDQNDINDWKRYQAFVYKFDPSESKDFPNAPE